MTGPTRANTHPSILVLDPSAQVSRAQAEGIIAKYAEAMSNADSDSVAELFTQDATRTDPVGGTTNHGKDEIREAVRLALPGPPARINFKEGPVRGHGNVFAFAFDHTVAQDNASRTLHGIDVFAFTSEGLIGYAVAYWGAEDRDERTEI